MRFCRIFQTRRMDSDVVREVNRVMANPEVNGDPVLLDFSKGSSSKGYSTGAYGNNYDRIFGSKVKSSIEKEIQCNDVPMGK